MTEYVFRDTGVALEDIMAIMCEQAGPEICSARVELLPRRLVQKEAIDAWTACDEMGYPCKLYAGRRWI